MKKKKGRVLSRHVFTTGQHGSDHYEVAKQFARQVRADHQTRDAKAFNRSVRVDDTAVSISVVVVREKLSGKAVAREPDNGFGLGTCFLCERAVYERHPKSALVGRLRGSDNRPEHFECLDEESRIITLKRVVVRTLESRDEMIVTEADFKRCRAPEDKRGAVSGVCEIRRLSDRRFVRVRNNIVVESRAWEPGDEREFEFAA